MTSRIIISLTDNEVNLLRKELRGIGGFQSLIASLRTKLHGSDLELDFADVERIARYVKQYGRGGFQGRLDGVLTEIEDLVHALRDIT
jgi:hypothetical protein